MRLLLAEDDPDLSLRLKRYLGKQGFAVDAVHNGIDAEFNGRETPYDAIVLDLGLPQRPGLEVRAHASYTSGHAKNGPVSRPRPGRLQR